ncbi:MAG: TetR family transcriptional regulator [Sphingobium sp. 66-54]|nr:MAG: TetR family transcriptional regulator [Sphingobium sp. 66-54]
MNVAITPRRRGRPPKATMGFSETRESLVRAGLVALTEKGFSATGIDEILKAVGVPKGSFYHYFDSKEAFGAELIDRYGKYFGRRLERFFADSERPHLQRLEAFTRDAEDAMARFAFSRGCLVGNLGQEMGALPESYRQQLSDVFVDWQHRTAACLRAAQAEGEIGTNHDVNELAAFFWIGWEGAVLRAKLERNADALRTFANGFFAMTRA